jgi:hypothetical protein
MPIPVSSALPTIFIRRESFEQKGLLRTDIDSRFNLTDEEFKVEGNLVAIGPLASDDMIAPMVEYLEQHGLEYFADYIELSGNWPQWLRLVAVAL